MTFKTYLSDLINSVPREVYILLLVVFCSGTVVLIGVKGWRKGLRNALGLLLMEYVFLLYSSTVIFRKVSEDVGHDFSLFWSYSKPELLVENIMNVVVFVPVGVLLGLMVNGEWFRVLCRAKRQSRAHGSWFMVHGLRRGITA